jgi:PLP dependent protein
MSPISANLQAVHAAIERAAAGVSRDPHAIGLLAVSKSFGAEAVLQAAACGQQAFGENYVQEAIDKIARIRAMRPDLALEWHYIGPIQANKTRTIAEYFDWVHSIEREKIAQRLSQQRPAHLPPLNVCVQVNISAESSKSGVKPDDVLPLCRAIQALPQLRLRGLMAIPEPAASKDAQRKPFAALRRLSEQLRAQGLPLDTLSMGMSADLDAAVAEGATMVRIGTAIFGSRHHAE